MSQGAGSLTIAARRAGSRTVLERVRYDGISRCSRAFARGDAALVVLSQLGPGVVRGDTVSTSGLLHAGAHLIVTQQAATRLLGGPRPSESRATWLLEEGAILELVGEPLVANAGARYAAATTVDLQGGSCLIMSELAGVPASADVRLRTCVRQFGRDLLYDAFQAAAAAPQAVGTFALVGLDQARIAPVVAALDRAADTLDHVLVGVGALPSGAFVRVLAADLWAARSALLAVRQAAWSALRDPEGVAAPPPTR